MFLLFIVIACVLRLTAGINNINPKYHNASYDFMDIYERNDSYRGEKFPEKYLSVEGITPTSADLSAYVESLMKTASYFAKKPNSTDPNIVLGYFLAQAVLKRTLLDYGDKIADSDKLNIEKIIKISQNHLSHFVYQHTPLKKTDLMYGLAQMARFVEPVVQAIREFNKNRLQKWIKSDIRVHDYIEQMDDMTYDRFDYAVLVASMNDYYDVSDSDHCIASISAHAVPIRYDKMEPCEWDVYCLDRVFAMPSSAYVLSHRYIYILGLHLSRRCYVVTEGIDMRHMDIMCANMYREAVYLARRGFFYRDLFLEHIALCGLLGYEEFHRHKWFTKALSWIDEDGCMTENSNFELNRTSIFLARAETAEARRNIRKMRRKITADECQHHQMALTLIVHAHAIRYAAHYL